MSPKRDRLKPFSWLILLLFCALIPGCGGGKGSSGGGPTPTPGPTVSPSPTNTSHVFLVVLENHSFSQVIDSQFMPYLNSLVTQGGLATNYFAVIHPSIGNYFMLTTGVVEST